MNSKDMALVREALTRLRRASRVGDRDALALLREAVALLDENARRVASTYLDALVELVIPVSCGITLAETEGPVLIVPRAPATSTVTRRENHLMWPGGPSIDRDAVRYAAYFENEHAEILVFVVNEDRSPVLYHSDAAGPRPVSRELRCGLILDTAEKTWLAACWECSAAAREGVMPSPSSVATNVAARAASASKRQRGGK